MDIKEFKAKGTSSEKKNHPWEYARAKAILNILKPYMNESCLSVNVLDIGCGDLFFLNQFHKKVPTFNFIAVDTAFDDELIRVLKNKYQDLPVDIYKNFKDIKFKEGFANFVFLLDVLEHIQNDKDFLVFLSRQSYVTDDTLFFVTVPAFNLLFSQHDKFLGHYRRYSHDELKRTVENAGYKYLQGGYFFFSLFLARMIRILADLLRKEEKGEVRGIGNWQGGKILSFFFEKLLLCDYYVCKLLALTGIKIPGLSTYALCKLQS